MLVVAVFLAVPAFVVRDDLAGRTRWEALGAEARMQLGFEAHTRRALDEGVLPLWNPYHFGGHPHLADPATLAVYPPHVLLRFLPIERFFALSFVLHACLFGTGAYLLARQLGGSALASWLGAGGALLAGVLTPGADLPYSPGLYSLAWLPLILALSMRSIQRGGLRPHAGFVAAAAMALTGPPRGQAYAFAAVASCYLFSALWPEPSGRSRRTLGLQALCLAALVAGLSAFQLVPHLRFWATAARAGGLAREDVRGRALATPSPERQGQVAAALSAMEGYRVAVQCMDRVDVSSFLLLGTPTIEGYGGAFLSDYGRFAAIVSDTRVPPAAGPSTMTTLVRRDLLTFMNAGYLVGCAEPDPDQWEVVAEIDGVYVSRAPNALPRAFWTCAPRRVTREEMDYRLKNFRYDEALTLREANPVVHVRWAAALDATVRREYETALKIRPRRFIDGTTWQYDLLDSTRANLAAIVNHPAVEDTAGFERGALTLPPPPAQPRAFSGRRSEWLLGMDACEDARPASIEQADRADGYFAAAIDAPRDGLVFVSEPYYAGRTAWVDGERVDPLKVNLAFTGIPVTAGVHRIELRAGAGSFWFGAGLTLLTLVGWAAHGWIAQG